MKYWQSKQPLSGWGHLRWYEGQEGDEERKMIEEGKAERFEVIDVRVLEGNPHYEAFNQIPRTRLFEIGTFMGSPVPHDDMMQNYVRQANLRIEMTQRYSWAIPTPAVIEYLRKIIEREWILEVGAGSGYFARMVTQAWFSPMYYAFDDYSSHVFPYRYYEVQSEPYKVENVNNLFLCWPYFGFEVEAVKKYNPKRIIYIGEGAGGCTASQEFFDMMESYEEIEGLPNQESYEGIHDHLYVWEMK